jgi:cytoskeletal protein RodZ
MEEENKKNKKKIIFGILIVAVILILIVFLGGINKVNAPEENEETAGQQEQQVFQEQATTTEDQSLEDFLSTVQENIIDRGVQENPGETVQVFEQDGLLITTKSKPVTGPTGPTPEIKEFTVTPNSTGSACKFYWDVKEAVSCDFVDINTEKIVRNLLPETNLQAGEGSYVLRCKGSGGIVTTSETLICL